MALRSNKLGTTVPRQGLQLSGTGIAAVWLSLASKNTHVIRLIPLRAHIIIFEKGRDLIWNLYTSE